jgi:hypothetical protein
VDAVEKGDNTIHQGLIYYLLILREETIHTSEYTLTTDRSGDPGLALFRSV